MSLLLRGTTGQGPPGQRRVTQVSASNCRRNRRLALLSKRSAQFDTLEEIGIRLPPFTYVKYIVSSGSRWQTSAVR